MKKNIIIVGGGISGLTTAAFLSKENLNVTLLEKTEKLGGLVGSFFIDDFLIDAGIRATENSGVLFPMLKSLDINNIKFKRNIVTIKIKDKSIAVKDQASLNEYKKMLIELFEKDKKEITEIIDLINTISQYMEILYGVDNPLFLDYKKDQTYLLKTILPWMIKYHKTIKKIENLNLPVEEYLKKITNNQALIDMIIQHFFKDTPTFFALSYFRLYNDYYYPEKGTQELIDELETYIIKNNAKILKNTEVIKINLKDKTLITNNETFSYDQIIWAADLKTLYKNTDQINSSNTDIKLYHHKKELINNAHGNDSIYSLYLTTNFNTDYYSDKCSEHTFFTPTLDGLSSMEMGEKELLDLLKQNKSKKLILKKWLKEFANKTTYEISIPVLRNKALAPDNKSAIIVSTVFDYDLTAYLKEENLYEYLKENLNNEIINCLNNTLFTSLKDNIIKYQSSSPITIEERFNNTDGAITGWSFSSTLPIEHRMNKMAKSINTPFKDIHKTGHWSFSPTGLPTSIILGKVVADRIIKLSKHWT